jgi:hypothetical protein
MTRITNLIAQRLSQAKTPIPDFVAPISGNREVAVFHNGRLLSFPISWADVGWFVVRAEHGGAAKRAFVVDIAHPKQYIPYLESLPAVLTTPLYPVNRHQWMVIPQNRGEGQRIGWNNGAPRLLNLVLGELDALSTVRARVFGSHLMFDTTLPIWSQQAELVRRDIEAGGDTFSHVRSPNLRTAAELVYERLQALRIEQAAQAEAERRAAEVAAQARAAQAKISLAEARRAEAAARNQLLMQRIENQMRFLGATISAVDNDGRELRISYTLNGMPHTVRIDQNLGGISGGICLNNTDREHNLASLVMAIEKGRDLHRPDIDKEYWR